MQEKITDYHRHHLKEGIQQLHLSLSDVVQEKLLQFLQLLQQWNETYNLTAINHIDEMIDRHLLDSFSIVPFIQGNHILDVGSGAGFPGIPLSFCFPERQFTLLESNGKKIRFLQQACMQFSLSNIHLAHTRLENYKSTQNFDTIVFRAVGAVNKLFHQAKHLLTPTGICLFMKSTVQDIELKKIPSEFIKIVPIQVPFLNAQRNLVIISKI